MARAPPSPRRLVWRPTLVALEARDCPAITDQFDYRFDTAGYYTPTRRALLDRAAGTIAQ